MEEAVSSAGPFICLIGMCVLPLLWSLPGMLYVCMYTLPIYPTYPSHPPTCMPIHALTEAFHHSRTIHLPNLPTQLIHLPIHPSIHTYTHTQRH